MKKHRKFTPPDMLIVVDTREQTPFKFGPEYQTTPGTLQSGDYSLKGFDGTPFKSAELAGKHVLVHIWSSTPVACGTDVQGYGDLSRYLGKVALVSVNVDTDLERFKRDLAVTQLPVTVWSGQAIRGRLVHAKRAQLPISLLVDGEGQIVAKHIGALGPEGLDGWVKFSISP